jgi:predicted secreted protein
VIMRALLTWSWAVALAAVAIPAASVPVTNPDIVRSATTSVVLGQRLTLRLPNRVESGRAWFLRTAPGPELQFVRQYTTRAKIELPDFPQDQIFEFNTKKPGVKVLRFTYASSQEGAPLRVLNMTVTITGKN